MGVNLTPIIVKKITNLDAFRGQTMAIDAYIVLYQFLALIRARDGTHLTDKEGRVTSHLVGLAFRTTKLITDYSIKPVFVFDGKPPQLKQQELETRRTQKRKAEEEYKEAIRKGDLAKAWSKAVQTIRLTREMVDDSKRLLDLLGIPWVQAPSEGEAQASYMAKKGDVWAASSRDYDSLLFGTPRLVRYLTIQGQKWLPSKGRSRKLKPELITLETMLKHHKITRDQLIDIAILIGTDFNKGIKGIGPKTALKLVKKHTNLENLPNEVAEKLPQHYPQVRNLFLNPEVTDNYKTEMTPSKEEELYSFLCDERSFSRDRVKTLANRITKTANQKSLKDWFGGN